MQVYLVGGAVRDKLLNLPIKDKDFMVVGTDSNTMKSLGFLQVGADFPVFLHPKTHHEYALARTERKNGISHQDFITQTQGVSLQDDLLRRDLTINALAIEVVSLFDDTPITGEVVDFYGGLHDLHHKVLRHVSPAFCEDPLRVLRVARFFARFAPLGFVIAPETQTLMHTISKEGQLDHLSCERIWAESARALNESGGFLYFDCLYQFGILPLFLPTLATLWQDNAIYQQSKAAATAACQNNASLAIRFALVLGGFGADNQPALNEAIRRLHLPKAIRQCVHSFISHQKTLSKLPAICAEQLLILIESTKAHKNQQLLLDLIQASQYWHAHHHPKSTAFITHAIACYQSIGTADIDPTLTGQAIGHALKQKRQHALQEFLDHHEYTQSQ